MKRRITPTANHGYRIVGGILYLHDDAADEDVFCGRLDDDYDPIDLPSYGTIRVESLSSNWYQNVWLPGVDKPLHEDIDMQMTLRTEKRSGELYMYAYRRVFGKLYKRYVGRAVDINQERLLKVARSLPSNR